MNQCETKFEIVYTLATTTSEFIFVYVFGEIEFAAQIKDGINVFSSSLERMRNRAFLP